MSSQPLWRGPFCSRKIVSRRKEKYVLMLVVASLLLLFYCALAFSPSKGSPVGKKEESLNKQQKVYKKIYDGQLTDNVNILQPVEFDLKSNGIEQVVPPVTSKPSSSQTNPKESSVLDSIPLIQGGEDPTAKEKRDYVKGMMKHAWEGYVQYAWGYNEVKPIAKSPHYGSVFGSAKMGATIIDAMDTLYIMGMIDDFKKGRDWIKESFDFNQMNGDLSVFEINIRYVGGLLTLFAFTGDDLYRQKAVHVADKLLPAFNSKTGIPYSLVNMKTGSAHNYGWASGGSSILSEFGTLHMEFAYLSEITGDTKYVQKVERIREVMLSTSRPGKLYPNYFNPKEGVWGSQQTSVGALGDSYYEYLLKEWLRSGKRDRQAKKMFDDAAVDIVDELLLTSKGGLMYFSDSNYGNLDHKMQHLACFTGGMYGLAAHEEKDQNSERWFEIADGITNTCHESYIRSDTKLGPEGFRFTNQVEAKGTMSGEQVYILRPETFESYFIMWRLTHNQKYRDWGWEAVQALEKHCKAEAGYSGLRNVYQLNGDRDDVQQSFFLAESLKYLYLLFSDDDLISLNQWVFNTEAHPLPIRGVNPLHRGVKSSIKTGKDLNLEPDGL